MLIIQLNRQRVAFYPMWGGAAVFRKKIFCGWHYWIFDLMGSSEKSGKAPRLSKPLTVNVFFVAVFEVGLIWSYRQIDLHSSVSSCPNPSFSSVTS